MTTSTSPSTTGTVYDRIAAVYDWYTAPMEVLGAGRARQRLFGRARGRVLELGVGTGLNLSSYPQEAELTAVDISPRMLTRARARASRLGRSVVLQQADIQALPFRDGSFDAVTAACVFCSVANPVQGLREAARVLRPGGQVLLYEHVRPTNPLAAKLADLISPLTRRLLGPELNRRTEASVQAAGLRITDLTRRGIWREITATPSSAHQPGAPAVAPG